MKEIILAGRPNSGKSTLFNRLASANQKVGNYAGCTVEKKTATVQVEGAQAFSLTDLPGLYSLNPNSLDEEVAIRHLEENKEKSDVVFVLDGNNLEQELTLPLLLQKKGYRIVIAVNMMDEVRANKKILNLAGMTELAGVPFFPVAARTGEGVESLKKFLSTDRVQAQVGGSESRDLVSLHREMRAKAREINKLNQGPNQSILIARDSRIDAWLLNKFLGPIIFFFVMFILFQSVFTWAGPASDGIESALGFLQELSKNNIKNELLASLVSDGVLAGVGSVLVFVPQIAILFLLIGLLEYSGYLPRVAYMVDRLMKPYGLDGKVFIPLLSSVACAVPGIMATRTIESERTRLFTIMISPLMTCSARLPVYALLISTFIPNSKVGFFSLPGLVMFSLYVIGVIAALSVALLLHKFDFQKRKHVLDFIHLPHYRLPNWAELFHFVRLRLWSFLQKAGTVIFAMSVLLWVLLTFPRLDKSEFESKQAAVAESPSMSEENKAAALELLEATHSAKSLEASYGGRLGKFLEPVFEPIGYDWKLSIGILASLAAREVFVASLGTVFSLGAVDEHTEGLSKVLLEDKAADGSPKYTLATCLSLLLFFAFSLQCTSTIGVVYRETNSWRIPAIMFVYMFFLAYGSAFVAYRVGLLFL
jgi:ferrous iron transport protein B